MPPKKISKTPQSPDQKPPKTPDSKAEKKPARASRPPAPAKPQKQRIEEPASAPAPAARVLKRAPKPRGQKAAAAPVAAPIATPSPAVEAAPPVAAPTRDAVEAATRAETQNAKFVGLSVLMVTPEAHPFAKTGGLAEVTGALPLALARLGHRVTLVLPRYRGIPVTGGESRTVTLTFGVRTQEVTFFTLPEADGVTTVLVDAPALFDREGLYGQDGLDYEDNPWRFAVLSRAALEYARIQGVRPSVIHAHDWQTGMMPVFQKMQLSSDPYVGGVPVVFTIHNLAFQGIFPASTLPALGLGWELLDVRALEYWGQISYLKGGVNFSERITTVSPTYAKEILTPELGFGFDGVLQARADALSGILNGIDVERWNPEADEFVPSRFSADDLAGKAAAKRALLEAVELPVSDEAMIRPLIGLVSRLTDQKGFDLIAAAVADLMQVDASWVMLGSGERQYEEAWLDLARRFPERVSTTIGFNERLAHLIEAGADIFLMPSQFEPCGLNQMYSHRYGTVPVVRATGGLEDTVRDASAGTSGTGFTFREYTPAALLAALARALEAYRNPQRWKEIQAAGMRLDHSWDASAREYVKVYEAAAARP